MHVEPKELIKSIAFELGKDEFGHLDYTLWWYARASCKGLEICWPVRPDFDFYDFTSPFGALSALLVRKDSIRDLVPKRFTDLPPGFLNKSRVHIINQLSFDFYKVQQLLSEFREVGFLRLQGPSYSTIEQSKKIFDSWAGRSGRALFAWMRNDWDCTYSGGCRNEPNSKLPNLPYKPEDHKRAIDEFIRLIGLSRPFAITFGNVTPAPNMMWIC
ncbi:hypothetical protein XA68_13573 [Ophiocordyceps unilateralis]|uniref:Uncharacterized protein n=1 Tax=Ophiocordyceps unilateralis TaxID=268505 RepID=A0A2A9PCC7_OPHUN|nr:hypothetical protein XA68_13573 [Ophiocordyceps unilateralis]